MSFQVLRYKLNKIIECVWVKLDHLPQSRQLGSSALEIVASIKKEMRLLRASRLQYSANIACHTPFLRLMVYGTRLNCTNGKCVFCLDSLSAECDCCALTSEVLVINNADQRYIYISKVCNYEIISLWLNNC